MPISPEQARAIVELHEAKVEAFREALKRGKEIRHVIVEIGRTIFHKHTWEKRGKISRDTVERTKMLLAQSMAIIDPTVWGVLHEHVLLAPELGNAIASHIKTTLRGKKIDFDDKALEAAMYLHEIGSVANAASYFHKDFIGEWIQGKLDVPEKVRAIIQSMEQLMRLGAAMQLSEGQLLFKEKERELTKDQLMILRTYVQSLTTEQMIFILADNLSKRDQKTGELFTIVGFRQYLETQEERYTPPEPSIISLDGITQFPSTTFAGKDKNGITAYYRRSGAVLQLHVVEVILERFQREYGLNYEDIRRELSKIVLVMRHEEVENLDRKVYNRDNNSHVMHITADAHPRLEALAQLLKNRRFIPGAMIVSPQTRAGETAGAIQQVFTAATLSVLEEVDEHNSPGPYKLGMTIDEFREHGPDVFDRQAWADFDHETRKSLEKRMRKGLKIVLEQTPVAGISMIVSHGTPIQKLLELPSMRVYGDRENLTTPRGMPEPGSVTVLVFGPHGELFTRYAIRE